MPRRLGCRDLRRTIQWLKPSAGVSSLTSTANAVQSQSSAPFAPNPQERHQGPRRQEDRQTGPDQPDPAAYRLPLAAPPHPRHRRPGHPAGLPPRPRQQAHARHPGRQHRAPRQPPHRRPTRRCKTKPLGTRTPRGTSPRRPRKPGHTPASQLKIHDQRHRTRLPGGPSRRAVTRASTHTPRLTCPDTAKRAHRDHDEPVSSVLPGHFRRCPVVREGGVEPPRPCGHWNLNPARLPIPPPAHLGVAASGLHLFGATAWRHLKISTPRRVGSHPFVSGARQANKEVGRGPAPAGADTPDRGRPRPERCGETCGSRNAAPGARRAPGKPRPRPHSPGAPRSAGGHGRKVTTPVPSPHAAPIPRPVAALPVPQPVDGARASTTGPVHGASEWTAGATHRTWRTAPHRPHTTDRALLAHPRRTATAAARSHLRRGTGSGPSAPAPPGARRRAPARHRTADR